MRTIKLSLRLLGVDLWQSIRLIGITGCNSDWFYRVLQKRRATADVTNISCRQKIRCCWRILPRFAKFNLAVTRNIDQDDDVGGGMGEWLDLTDMRSKWSGSERVYLSDESDSDLIATSKKTKKVCKKCGECSLVIIIIMVVQEEDEER